jgi:hypothetical protein
LIALPAWPLIALFIGFPVWWLLGLGDMIWPVAAVPMALLLIRAGRRVQVPRGFGVWLLFVVWMLMSVIEIDNGPRLVGFLFRAAQYLAVTVIFIYVYNGGSSTLPTRRVASIMAGFWIVVVLGGYLGVFDPTGVLHTLAGKLVPSSLASNDAVAQMITPHFTEYNPNSFRHIAPRPSAPFSYTNNWGNAYSLLLPFVFIALAKLRRGPLFWLLAVLVPLSLVPAYLTLNRGMFLALGVGLLYAVIRFAARGHARALLALGLFLVLAGGLATALPVKQKIENRVASSNTNQTRAAVYDEAFDRTLRSPLFGYGAPRPSERIAGAPSIGTQGQLWMVLFSFGFVGAGLFMGWLAWLVWRTRHARTTSELWAHVTLLMALIESVYYGMLTAGLAVAMVAAALALRERAFVSAEAEPAAQADLALVR